MSLTKIALFRVGVTFVIVFVLSVKWGHTASANNDNHVSVFNVHIAIDMLSLETDIYHKIGLFYVDTEITNTTTDQQRIVVWTQYGWSWISTNPGVSPGIEAAKNGNNVITLKPSETYKHKLEMFTSSGKPVSFQLGFTPAALEPLAGQANITNNEKIFWSNQVTLTR